MEKESKLSSMTRRWRKRRLYARLRQHLPMAELACIDDHEAVDAVEPAVIDWPAGLCKPRCGVVQDPGPYPRWTKYRRFLEHNGFEYGIYNLHAHDWLEKVQGYDVIIGMPSSEFWHLEETRRKYRFIQAHFGKTTYPSPEHAALYEDKELEACLAEICGMPFAKTYVSHDRNDAHCLVDTLTILSFQDLSRFGLHRRGTGAQPPGGIGQWSRRFRQLVEVAYGRLAARRTTSTCGIYLVTAMTRVIVVDNQLFGNYRARKETFAPQDVFSDSRLAEGNAHRSAGEHVRQAWQ